ncbi:MAG: SIMPL domain-containing protein, partial [Planctomycetota bacterium]|nr:SIMPL domain-containing protein [Planctomycetota bacterium]
MAGSFAYSLVWLVGTSFFPPASGPTVSVDGSGRRSFDPDTAQVRWRVYASGKTYKSALGKLDSCRGVLKKRLADIEEPRPAHRFGPSLDHASSEDKAGMQARIMAMAMGQGNDDKRPGDKIRLAFQVTLEWTLDGDTLQARQRQVDLIRDQLR